LLLFAEHGALAPEKRRIPRRSWVCLLSLAALLHSFVSAPAQAQLGQLPSPGALESSVIAVPKPLTAGDTAHARASAEPEYLISPDDVLEVYVLDVPELSRAYEVSATGKVTLPLLAAPVVAAGLTLEQFSQLVRARLQEEGFVSDARVSTSVRESRVHAVAITGAVKRPQMYRVLGRTTLLDMLSQAEGVTDDAGTVAMVRRGDIAVSALQARSPQIEVPRAVSVDLERLLGKGDAAANIDIYPGDRIVVPRAGIVYVVGAVNRPGGFPLKTGRQSITVLQALALAEDLKTTAVRSKAVIIHGDAAAPGGRRQRPIDLKKLLAGKSPDPPLVAEDILFVPDSSSRRALKRGAEAALQMATGLAIYRF
jgi:polysaccharide export outer membrane protein